MTLISLLLSVRQSYQTKQFLRNINISGRFSQNRIDCCPVSVSQLGRVCCSTEDGTKIDTKQIFLS